MQNKPLLTLSLFILIGLASASRAEAQWPEHSVFAPLPAPVATPSDELAAFTYRMEVLIDQAPPEHATPAQFNEYLTPALERLRQLSDHPPRPASPAEAIVIEGIHAHFAEITAQRIEAFVASLRGVDGSSMQPVIDGLRGNALMHWREVARVTDPSPNARAWVAYAEARLRALADTILGRSAATTPVEHRVPERRTASCGADAMESAARRLLREAH